MHEGSEDLVKYRLECAQQCIESAKALLKLGESGLKGAANRSYYAFFHAMRAVLAKDLVDFKKHSALMAYFRQHYIKEGKFPVECSKQLTTLFRMRQMSDYEDFYLVSKAEVAEQTANAEAFIDLVKKYSYG